MRPLLVILVTFTLLAVVGVATAQTPLPAFAYFTCVCQPGSPALVPTPNLLAPTASSWHGNVYALSDADAQFKAKNACASESRGTLSICDSCRCFK
jgi:hypothetical protein